MRNLVIVGSVMVTLLDFFNCSINKGTTLQLVHKTFHHLIQTKSVFFDSLLAAIIIFSHTALQVPYILKGSTALSVETSMTFFILFSILALITFCIQIIFV